MKKVSLLIFCLLLTSMVYADIIELKSGERIFGEIIEKNEEYIKMKINDIDTTITYYRKDISSIITKGKNLEKGEVEVKVASDLTQEGTTSETNYGELTEEQQEFQDSFKTCTPGAKFELDTGPVIYQYEIIGPADDGCKVQTYTVKHVNPEWENKTMDCVYDNKIPFDEAMSDMTKCSGELYSLMTGQRAWMTQDRKDYDIFGISKGVQTNTKSGLLITYKGKKNNTYVIEVEDKEKSCQKMELNVLNDTTYICNEKIYLIHVYNETSKDDFADFAITQKK